MSKFSLPDLELGGFVEELGTKRVWNGWRSFDQFPNPPKASKNLFRTLSQNGSFFLGATVHVQNPALVEMAMLRYIECYIQPVIASYSCLTSSIPLFFTTPKGLAGSWGPITPGLQRRHQRIYLCHRHVSVSPVLKLLHCPCQGYIFVLKRMKKNKKKMMMMMMLADVMVVISWLKPTATKSKKFASVFLFLYVDTTSIQNPGKKTSITASTPTGTRLLLQRKHHKPSRQCRCRHRRPRQRCRVLAFHKTMDSDFLHLVERM